MAELSQGALNSGSVCKRCSANNVTSTAVCFCKECTDYLCQKHLDKHKRDKKTRKHTILPMEHKNDLKHRKESTEHTTNKSGVHDVECSSDFLSNVNSSLDINQRQQEQATRSKQDSRSSNKGLLSKVRRRLTGRSQQTSRSETKSEAQNLDPSKPSETGADVPKLDQAHSSIACIKSETKSEARNFEPSQSSETGTDVPTLDQADSSLDCINLQIFHGPMCLVSTNQQGSFSIEEETLNQIKKIDHPLVVVAIAGLYRTGKSYLMNRLAGSSSAITLIAETICFGNMQINTYVKNNDKNDVPTPENNLLFKCTKGFQLGNSIQSETKGIWAWCRPHPIKENHVIVLLDTEGLGDVKKGDTGYDNKIFTLAALLCNVLVYNIMTAFNNDAIEKLTFITEISKHIKFKRRGQMDQYSDEKLALVLPTFVLCVRDFTLTLEKDGVELSEDEYLNDCLELQPGKDINSEKYNRPRECISKYFQERKCFTFDRPAEKDVMKRLDRVTIGELSESFVKDTECFMQFVFDCEGKVLLGSKPVRGIMFASLVESYVDAIREGAVPDVDDAISVVSKLENERVAAAAVQSFKQELETIKLPVLKKEDFRKIFQSIQESSLLVFRGDAMFDSEPFQKEAAMIMEKLWEEKSKKNEELILKHCYDKLQEIYDSSVGKHISEGTYNVAGGFSNYKMDISKLGTDYRQITENIDAFAVQKIWHTFLEDETKHEMEIMIADRKLLEEDRKRELDKIRKENQRVQEEQKELYQLMLKEEKCRAEKHFAKLETEREAYMKQEEEKMKEIMDTWSYQQDLNEKQMKMMSTENESLKGELRQEIKRLNKEILVREQENKARLKRKETEHKEQANNLNSILSKLLDSINEENHERELLRSYVERMNNRGWFKRLFNIDA